MWHNLITQNEVELPSSSNMMIVCTMFLLYSWFSIFLKNGEFIIPTQKDFQTHYILDQSDVFLDRKTVLLWTGNFTTACLTLNTKLAMHSQMTVFEISFRISCIQHCCIAA